MSYGNGNCDPDGRVVDVSLSDEMEAFDSLDPKIREAIRYCGGKYCAILVLGVSTRLGVGYTICRISELDEINGYGDVIGTLKR